VLGLYASHLMLDRSAVIQATERFWHIFPLKLGVITRVYPSSGHAYLDEREVADAMTSFSILETYAVLVNKFSLPWL